MSQDTQPSDPPRRSIIPPFIDARVSLTWLLTVAVGLIAGGYGLYHQIGSQGDTLKEMKEQIKDLKITVNAGNSQTMTLSGEIAILRFRVETIEADRKAQR